MSVSKGGEAGGPPTRSVLLALIPNSTIQFVDFELAEREVVQVRRRFVEETTEEGEPSLHIAATSDGVFHHPVSGLPCDPRLTYTFGGTEALEPFLGAWLPVPFMAVREGDGDGQLTLDEGPSNWTRVHITRHQIGPDDWIYRVVLAIDTSIEADGVERHRAYAGPTLEDLKTKTAYRFSEDVNDVAWFVSEAWVDDWIKACFERDGKPDEIEDQHRRLKHLAGYLTLLAVLKDVCALPALRFMEPNAVGAFAETVPVDLALDLGSARLAALLQERHVGSSRDADVQADATWHLAIRDLTQPWRVEGAACSSRVTFSRAAFGSEALSRWSGRMNAFHWPAPARVGAEAERLAAEVTASEAAVGVSSPMHYVWDERPSRHVWRYAGALPDMGERRNPVVSGSILAHLTEDGELIDQRAGQGTTTKPRFSRSSLVTLLAAEILIHGLGAINAPAGRESRGKPNVPRRLERLLVTPPSGMGEAELAILRRRLEAAVKLVWQAMGWSKEGHPLAPLPPGVVVVADSATSTQIAYLENEIAFKFRGRAEGLLSLLGRPRAGFAGARSLRIAALDIGAATTSLAVATWEPASGDALVASRQLVDGFELGHDDVIEAVAGRFLVPALCERLAECKHPAPEKLMSALLGDDQRARPAWVGDLGRRLVGEMLAPAARTLLNLYSHSEADGGDAPSELTIAALLASADVDARAAADRFDIVAADDGADGFAPLDVSVPFLMRDLAAVARQAFRPVLDGVVRLLAALDCDLVLLSGEGARLPFVHQHLVAGLALRPDRIVDLHRHRFAPWYPGRSTGEPKLLAAAGALIQARGTFGDGGPAIVLRGAERSSQIQFVGRVDGHGRIPADDVIFELEAGNSRPNSRTTSTQQSRAPAVARIAVPRLPAVIGSRATSIDTWPARATWVIERAPDAAAGRGPKLPLRVNLEVVEPEHGNPGGIRMVAAIDGDGGRLDISEVVLRLKTRRFEDGHWRDTGHFAMRTTGGSR